MKKTKKPIKKSTVKKKTSALKKKKTAKKSASPVKKKAVMRKIKTVLSADEEFAGTDLPEFKKQNMSVYEKNAEYYANLMEMRLPQYQLVKFISFLKPKSRILDAGCSAGRDSRYLYEEGFEVIGIDICKRMVDEAKKRAKEHNADIQFKLMDIEDLKFREKSFNGVWCFGALNHLKKQDLQKTINGFNKVLEKEGVVFIIVEEGIGEEVVKSKQVQGEELFYSYYTQLEIEDALKNAGFEILTSSVENKEITVYARKKHDI